MIAFGKRANKKSFHVIPVISALIVILTGLSTLFGWVLNIPILASMGSPVPMAPSTALLFILFGVLVFYQESNSGYMARMAMGYAGVLISVFLSIVSYLGIHLNIEHLGMPISDSVGNIPLGYISPLTAFVFVLAGFSQLLLTFSKPLKMQRAIPSFILASLVLLFGTVLIFAYLIGAPVLSSSDTIPPAFSTSLSFFALGISLVFYSGKIVWKTTFPEKITNYRNVYYLIGTFLLLAIGIIATGYLYYRNYEQHYKTEMGNQLTAVADLKVDQITRWKNEKYGDALVLYRNIALTDLVSELRTDNTSVPASKALISWFRQIQGAYQYDRISLLDTYAKVLISITKHDGHSSAVSPSWLKDVATQKKIIFHDLYRDSVNDRIYMSLLVPVITGETPGQVIGIVEMRIDPEEYLFPMIKNWPVPSTSVENLLIRRDGNDALFLNELRFRSNTALNLRSPLTEKQMPAVKAALGEKGIVEGLDYRGVPVIAYITSVPDTRWYLISRMDKVEIFAQLRNRLWGILILIIALLICTGTIIAYIWKQQYIVYFNEKYQTLKALHSSVEKFVKVFQSKSVFMAIMRTDGSYVDVNEFVLPFLGYNQSELVNRNPESIGLFNEAGMMKRISELMEQTGHIHNMEVGLRTKEGLLRFGNMSVEVLESGEEKYWLSVTTDITDLKEASARIVKLNRVYAVLSDINQAIVRIRNPHELFERTCQIALEKGHFALTWIGMLDEKNNHLIPVAMAGKSKGYLETINLLLHDSPCAYCPIDKAIHEGGYHSCNITSFDSGLQLCQKSALEIGLRSIISFGLTVSGKIKGVINFYAEEYDFFNEDEIQLLEELAMDLSFSMEFNEKEEQRKRAGKALYESEKRLHLLIDGVTDHAIYPLDASGHITMWNKGAERLHGYRSDEVIGKHYSMFFTTVDKKEGKAQLWLEAAAKNNSIQVEGESIRKDGSVINVNTVITALRNDDESLYGFSNITHDITSRKQTEDKIKSMNAVLEERVKERTAELDSINKELESFAYSISHDLKAPLRAISSFAQILQEDHIRNLNSEGQDLIATIISSVKRMDQLIRDILSLSRFGRKEITYQLIEMKELVHVVYHELTDENQQRKISFLVQDMPGAYCDSVLINQVWINLISNAIKYSSKKKNPAIEIFGKKEGNMIVYTIRDNGAGFNPNYKDKLFILFQRLHNSREFEGTGAGLAIVKRIVQRFGGDVYAEGNPGKGASFSFSLPASRK